MAVEYKTRPHPHNQERCPFWDVYQDDVLIGMMWFGASSYWYTVKNSVEHSVIGKAPEDQMDITLEKLAQIVADEYNQNAAGEGL